MYEFWRAVHVHIMGSVGDDEARPPTLREWLLAGIGLGNSKPKQPNSPPPKGIVLYESIYIKV